MFATCSHPDGKIKHWRDSRVVFSWMLHDGIQLQSHAFPGDAVFEPRAEVRIVGRAHLNYC